MTRPTDSSTFFRCRARHEWQLTWHWPRRQFSAGRAAANLIDGSIDFTRKAMLETGDTAKAFATGEKSQQSMNGVKHHYGDILEFNFSRA